jgi:hypothetical protein
MSNVETMGSLGENLVSKLMGVVLSEDKYDTVKDGILPDGSEIEIKTQNRHPTKDMFTISSVNNGNGLPNIIKCFSVDNLVFVEYDSTDYIKIWLCTNRKKYNIFVTKSGKEMIGFPISEMTLLHDHYDPELAKKMRSISQSSVFRK